MNPSSSEYITGNLIAASAGTGKTYQLTSRFVALLALGARPEKMIALTFTKKAAGEFRNRIFQALSDGALGKADYEIPQRNAMAARVWETWTGLHLAPDYRLTSSANPVALYPAAIPMMKRAAALRCYPEELTPIDGEPPLPQLNTDFFAELLLRVLNKVSDLQLSTLDSFFNRVVAADLHRAGLSSVTPMSTLQQQRATRSALMAMLAESEKSAHHESALLTLLTNIADDKGGALLELLEQNISTYLSLYKEFPEQQPWGNPAPFGLPNCAEAALISNEDVAATQCEIDELTEAISWTKKRSYVKKTMAGVAAKIRKCFTPSPSFASWLAGESAFLPPAPEQAQDNKLREVIQRFSKQCNELFLRTVQERSAAMYSLLQKYYEAYRESILSEGLCTFDDIKQGARRLLGADATGAESGMALTLTTKLDHWMLDEFQDTDPVQWEILSNLLKENAQYTDKSLFVVGDKKQSIYSFRGASAELFEQLRGTKDTADGYNWQKQVLTNSSLSESRRSVPAIMNFTNLVFGALNEVDSEFSQHRTHANNANKKGYVRVKVLPKNKTEQTLQDTCAAIGDILDELTEPAAPQQRRLRNGISVAILLRKGDYAREIVAWLRRYKPEIPVQLVEDSPLTEASPLGELLLSFFMWLREPADKYRYNILRVSPLGNIMHPANQEDKHTDPSVAWDAWLRKLNEQGYAAVIQQLANYLPRLTARRMLTEWMEEALSFDAAGGSLDEWLLHMRTCCRKETGAAQFVQVMTMHKSKGAEFDAVILPFLGSKAVDQPRAEGIPYFISDDKEGILIHPGTADERKKWAALQDCENKWKKAKRDDSYNLMYVALTRARYANYILLPGGEKLPETPAKESDWILSALIRNDCAPSIEQNTEFGHADWYTEKTAKSDSHTHTAPLQPLGTPHRARTRVSPSAMTDNTEQPQEKRLSEHTSGADFGTAVHECWEQITWLNAPLPEWVNTPQTEAQQVVAAALQQAEVQELFTPRPGQEVYCEQSIEAITGADEWVSGTLDRLVLTTDTAGRTIAAHIIDFKTNKLRQNEPYQELKKEYTGQMTAYKRLISQAFDLPAAAVKVSLLSCPKGHIPARVLPYTDAELPI
ncbi:MAG: hypothetical protein E7030_03520 [Akkermansiaceae bacterium]|nr:hypothetical protein [Akkermansiaceae bacterium]